MGRKGLVGVNASCDNVATNKQAAAAAAYIRTYETINLAGLIMSLPLPTLVSFFTWHVVRLLGWITGIVA